MLTGKCAAAVLGEKCDWKNRTTYNGYKSRYTCFSSCISHSADFPFNSMEAVRSIHAPAPAQSLAISKPKSVKVLSRRSEVRNPRLRGARFLTIASAGDVNSLKKAVTNSNYVVPLDNSAANSSSCITRPLVEILRDLNKRVPDKVVKTDGLIEAKYIPWYHANRMLSFYAPGWCGELRNVTFSADGRTVSVVYRVTIRGSDGEAYREASGTVSLDDDKFEDPVQVAEALSFQRACARFGLGLYLYHEDDTQ